MSFFEYQAGQQGTASYRETQAENSARLGFSHHRIEVRGSMSGRLPDPIMFTMGFTEEPFFTSGVAIASDPDPSLGWVPQATCGVWQWHRNKKGQYTGAYIYVSMSSKLSALEDLVLQHHLAFAGVAYKDLGSEVLTDAQTLTPRTVGFGGN